MRDVELKARRDRDLYRAYCQGLRKCKFATLRDAADYARKQPAPQFYISAREAMQHIGRINRGYSLEHLNPLARKRILFIYDLYMAYRREHPEDTPREAIEYVVEQPAPEFYIGAEMARKILLRERQKVRAKWFDL